MERIELIAAACHQAWFAYTVLGLGEPGEPWETAPDYQKSSIRHSIRFWDELDVFAIPMEHLCAASHLAWANQLKREGWKYGPMKDLSKREHPCLLPYDDLPLRERRKDEVVVRTYMALRSILGSPSFTE